MKIKELLDTTIGAMASACLANNPELKDRTPEILQKMRLWANENSIPLDGLFCAIVNYMGVNCEEFQGQADTSEMN